VVGVTLLHNVQRPRWTDAGNPWGSQPHGFLGVGSTPVNTPNWLTIGSQVQPFLHNSPVTDPDTTLSPKSIAVSSVYAGYAA